MEMIKSEGAENFDSLHPQDELTFQNNRVNRSKNPVELLREFLILNENNVKNSAIPEKLRIESQQLLEAFIGGEYGQ